MAENDVVQVIEGGETVFQIIDPGEPTVFEIITAGPQGPPGVVDDAEVSGVVAAYFAGHPLSEVHTYDTPVSSLVIDHGLGRIPNASLFVGGVSNLIGYTATDTQVFMEFPGPTSGVVVVLN